MNFEFSHAIPAGVDEVAAALLDVDYQNSLTGMGRLSERTVLDQYEMDDGRVRRRVRCVLEIDVSGPARRFLGDADPAWVEDALWFPDKRLWEWRIIPEVAAELLVSNGHILLQESTDGSDRVVAGKVQVRVPLYGGKVEGFIVEGLRRAYDEEALQLAAWLDR